MGSVGATGAYGAANNIDLTQHLVTELRKAMEAKSAAPRDENGNRYVPVDYFVVWQTVKLLSASGSSIQEGEQEVIPLTMDMMPKHKNPLMEQTPRFTHNMSAEEKERQELLMRAMPVGVIMTFHPDVDPNSGNEYPGKWEKVSELWERIE